MAQLNPMPQLRIDTREWDEDLKETKNKNKVSSIVIGYHG
jgi:hypothetical protein